MTVALPGQLPAIVGFALPAGLSFALATMLLVAYPPRLDMPVEETAVERPSRLTYLYITLDAPIFINLGTGPRMRLDLAVSVEGTQAQLLELNRVVDGAQSRVMAEIVAEANDLVMEGADSAKVHEALPGRARARINAMLGSEDFPEPVSEVLILGLAVQG